MKRALIQVVVLALVIFPGVRQSFGQLARTTNLLAVADASLSSNHPDAPFVAAGGYTQPFTPPTLFGATITNGLFQFSFNVEPNHGYVIQHSDDLTGTNWVTVYVLDPPLRPTTATINEFMTTSNRFYRVLALGGGPIQKLN